MSFNAGFGQMAEFVSHFEFAVCPIEQIEQGTIFSGDVVNPWLSFKASDVTAGAGVVLKYDGQTLSGSGAAFTQHAATDPVFGGSSKHTGWENPKWIELSVAFSIALTALASAYVKAQIISRLPRELNPQVVSCDGKTLKVKCVQKKSGKLTSDQYIAEINKALHAMQVADPVDMPPKLTWNTTD